MLCVEGGKNGGGELLVEFRSPSRDSLGVDHTGHSSGEEAPHARRNCKSEMVTHVRSMRDKTVRHVFMAPARPLP